jgi:hypothetical protein
VWYPAVVRSWYPTLVVIALALDPNQAAAQVQNAAASQFDWGLSEMMAGRYATGCPALSESYRLDPRPGALFTLAECENKWGKSATALAHYEAYLDAFGRMTEDQQRQQIGRDKIASAMRDVLRKDVPYLTITLPPSAAPGTVVKRDGETLGRPSLGVALPTDPGEHVIIVQTPDGRSVERRVTLRPGRRETVTPELEGAPQSAAPTAAPPDRGPAASNATTTESVRAGSHTWAYVAGGVGVAGLAVGTVGGLLALGEKSTIQARCGVGGDPHLCDAQGKSAADIAQTEALVGTIGFVVGAAGVAGAVILWLAAPRRSATGARAWSPVAAVAPGGWLAGARASW